MPLYTGKLGNSVIGAQQPIIVRFKNGNVLEFPALEEAYGFIKFYSTNPTATTENPGKIYQLVSGVWLEQPEIQPGPPPQS
jgi:hypothetical protein